MRGTPGSWQEKGNDVWKIFTLRMVTPPKSESHCSSVFLAFFPFRANLLTLMAELVILAPPFEMTGRLFLWKPSVLSQGFTLPSKTSKNLVLLL